MTFVVKVIGAELMRTFVDVNYHQVVMREGRPSLSSWIVCMASSNQHLILKIEGKRKFPFALSWRAASRSFPLPDERTHLVPCDRSWFCNAELSGDRIMLTEATINICQFSFIFISFWPFA